MIAAALAPAQAGSPAAPSSYSTACRSCHKPDGSGVPGVFPRISNRLEGAARTAEGRKWLIATILFGQSGEIVVDGKSIRSPMPAFARLSDSQVAETLNWLLAGSGKPFSAAEVAAMRAQTGMSAAKVGKMRAELAKAGTIE